MKLCRYVMVLCYDTSFIYLFLLVDKTQVPTVACISIPCECTDRLSGCTSMHYLIPLFSSLQLGCERTGMGSGVCWY